MILASLPLLEPMSAVGEKSKAHPGQGAASNQRCQTAQILVLH